MSYPNICHQCQLLALWHLTTSCLFVPIQGETSLWDKDKAENSVASCGCAGLNLMLFVVSGHVWALKSNTRSNHHCGENCKNSGRFIAVAWPYATTSCFTEFFETMMDQSGGFSWRNIKGRSQDRPCHSCVRWSPAIFFSRSKGAHYGTSSGRWTGATGSLGCWAVSKQTRLSERISVYKPIRALEFRDDWKIYTSVI